MVIGVDPHKSTHTATVLDPVVNRVVASLRIEASWGEYRRLLGWGRRWPDRRWAVENASGLGRHLAQWLLARGEMVLDVSPAATARVRQLSRGGGRKNDVIDAAAAATIAAAQGDARVVAIEDDGSVLALLDERRVNLSAARVRIVNQLHALLRDLRPGGAPVRLSAGRAAALLRGIRPSGSLERVRTQLARDLLADLRRLDEQLAANARQMQQALGQYGSTLMNTPGVGPVLAARLIGRTGVPTRFRSAAAFANYAGVAPIEIASADKARHRLSRAGDRQLNSVLHTVAITQIRMPDSVGRAYYDRKIAQGKTPREAQRCLKRRLADHLWRTMIADQRRRTASPGGQPGATTTSSAADPTPTANSSDKPQPGPTTTHPTPTHPAT